MRRLKNHRDHKIIANLLQFNINRIHFQIVRRRTEMTHQQRVSRSGSCVIKPAVGEWRQRPPFAFVLKEDILSTCSNKNDVM